MISDPKLPSTGDTTGVETPIAGASQGSQVHSETPVERNRAFRRPVSAGKLWLRRLGVLLFVFLCATIGVMLMILPWRPEWSDNPLLLPYPAIRDIVAGGFTRGLVTGLGLLNVWIGFWEAMRYRED